MYRIVSDHLGTPRVVVHATTGAVVQRFDVHAFGELIVDTSPGWQPFGFAGGLYDPDTGLVRFGARDYDPQAGRWTAKDPVLWSGGDPGLMNYVANDPVNGGDATGLAIDTVVDLGFIAKDLLDIFRDNVLGACGNFGQNVTALGLDGLGAAVPFLSGLGRGFKALARFGDASGTVFKTGHYAPRLRQAGVNVGKAESAVADAVTTMRPNMAAGAEVRGRIRVDGVLVEYRAMMRPDGFVNVGTIFKVGK